MARKHQILFEDDEIEAATSWHGGGSSMLYAISSTGKLSLGTQRPRGDDGPMTDDEWFSYIAANLEGEAEEAIEMAKAQMKGASRQEKDELKENIAAFKSIIRKTKQAQKTGAGLSGPRRESDILYENATHWVSLEPSGDMYVWRIGLTHSTRAGIIGRGYDYDTRLKRAIAEADRRNR